VPRLFVDTSAFYALADRSDGHHAAASAAWLRSTETDEPVTSDHVVVESWLLLRARLGGRKRRIGLHPEHCFDYRKGKRHRFTARMAEGPLIVLVEPDVAEVFRTPEAVNRALRALIEAIPPKATAGSR
jgi:predicted nucleic acid-binding protein